MVTIFCQSQSPAGYPLQSHVQPMLPQLCHVNEVYECNVALLHLVSFKALCFFRSDLSVLLLSWKAFHSVCPQYASRLLFNQIVCCCGFNTNFVVLFSHDISLLSKLLPWVSWRIVSLTSGLSQKDLHQDQVKNLLILQSDFVIP